VRRERVATLVTEAFIRSDETYGYRRIHAQLGLVACQPRPWRVRLTEPDGHASRRPDLVGRDFTADAPGQRMVGDITYISTWEGWLYLATVIDCHTTMVIGYALDDHDKTPLIQAALGDAADRNTLEPGAIFHTDRGSDYTSHEFARTLTELGLRHSVGGTGVCYEVSRRRESHPPPLSEPCLTVSRYTAPTVEPVGNAPCFQCANMPG